MGRTNDQKVLLRLNLEELQQMKARISNKQLARLKENQTKILANNKLYYDKSKDERAIRSYYRNIPFKKNDSALLFQSLHKLIKKTHTQKFPYYFSKDQFLYTWVDLQPDGTIKSIYSGEKRNPHQLIEEDFQTIQKRYEDFKAVLDLNGGLDGNYLKVIQDITTENKFNAEHVVPQSWFQAKEPMKGDLHHLFACQPDCNAKRSNYPYFDFPNYIPESPYEVIRNHCGVSQFERFEPEYGKGQVARAMLYFLLRYPKKINRRFRRKIDINLLIRWHEQFPITLYEQHRNRAIFLIQGNRNPFIDFPKITKKMDFYV